MKTNKIIICSIISIFFTSCLTFKYNDRIITHVNRDGTCRVEIPDIMDSDSVNYTYYLSSGWETLQIDTVLSSEKIRYGYKFLYKISKIFPSVSEKSADTSLHRTHFMPKESLKKRFRWFYTYYVFTAVYPEVSEKGRVPMEQYLNQAEQKFLLRGDISAYRGRNGFEMKEELDKLETKFWKWYFHSVYEESFDAILHYAGENFRLQLPAIKDSLYSMNKKRMEDSEFSMRDMCMCLDQFYATNHFSKVYAENKNEIDAILEAKTRAIKLLNLDFLYELTLPGKLISTNSDQQNDGTLVWHVNMLKFLADDYTLTAESRRANIWAFVVTLLLIAFSVYCFCRYFNIVTQKYAE